MELTISTNVIWLNVHALYLSILNHDSVALAAVGAQERGGGEFDVKSAGEGAAGIGQEADPAALVSIE
jgi:hypothetical protein